LLKFSGQVATDFAAQRELRTIFDSVMVSVRNTGSTIPSIVIGSTDESPIFVVVSPPRLGSSEIINIVAL